MSPKHPRLLAISNKEFFCFEDYLKGLGYSLIAGVDEAGRGAIAGPVFAAAVIFPPDFYSPEIKDSKKLTPQKREQLYEYICEKAITYSVEMVEVEEINKIGIFRATYECMRKAVEKLKITPQIVLVDGPFPIPNYKVLQKAIVNGDVYCLSISAASIIAKVDRDRYMRELAYRYPQYGFEIHKGYATKLHLENIKKYGPTLVHRTYFRCFK